MSTSEDGERMPWVNNGTSTISLRRSKTIFGNLTHLISKVMEDQPTLDVQQLIQDGGNFSDMKVLKLLTKEER